MFRIYYRINEHYIDKDSFPALDCGEDIYYFEDDDYHSLLETIQGCIKQWDFGFGCIGSLEYVEYEFITDIVEVPQASYMFSRRQANTLVQNMKQQRYDELKSAALKAAQEDRNKRQDERRALYEELKKEFGDV